MYYQQALGTGQDMATASATALTAYTAWANYAAAAASATSAGDPSASSKYSPAYNSVPPPNQIMAGTVVASTANTTVPSTAYGYAMPTSTMAPNSNYSAAYAAYYGYGAVNAQPPPPPEWSPTANRADNSTVNSTILQWIRQLTWTKKKSIGQNATRLAYWNHNIFSP